MDRLATPLSSSPRALAHLDADHIQDNDFRQNNTFFYFAQLEQPRRGSS